MGYRLYVYLLILIVMLFMPSTASANPDIFLSVGMHSASYGKDLRPGKYVDIHPGPGAVLIMGLKFTANLALDIKVGRTTQTEEISSSKVNNDWVEIGPVYYFLNKGNFRSYVSAGGGRYKVNTTGLDPEGTGYYVGAGFEELINEHHSAKLYFEDSRWEDDDLELEVSAFHVGLVYNYSF